MLTNNFLLCYNQLEVVKGGVYLLGHIIFVLRHNLSLSQAGLAARCNVTQQFVQQIESGKRTPSLKVAKRIAAALGVTVDYLIGEKKAG